jgi:hypothetical protein
MTDGLKKWLCRQKKNRLQKAKKQLLGNENQIPINLGRRKRV